MPELPEVETIRRTLAPIKGKRIESLFFSELAPIETCSKAKIRQNLQAVSITELKRIGKYLLICTSNDKALVIHLGMTGQLTLVEEKTNKRPKHTHLELKFSDDSLLRFVDSRRFGTLSQAKNDGSENAFLARLGPDFLDSNFTKKDFIKRCRRHSKLNLKNLSLHQGIATGLGNIYACEALYAAKLHPEQKVINTSDLELAALFQASRKI